MKKTLRLLIACVLALSMAACGGSGNANSPAPGGNSASAGDISGEIIIGGIAPLTGGVSQYGNAVNNGALLAVQEINEAGGILGGRMIRFTSEDDKGDPTESINAYNKLVQSDNVVAIVGPVTTTPSIAVAQVAARERIPMITATATGADVTKAGDNFFRACFIDPYQGELMAHYAKDRLGAATVAILYDTGDNYSLGVAEAFRDTARELGIEIVGGDMEGYTTDTDDFSAQLTKIREGNPDAIMAPVYYEDAAKIVTQARALGIEAAFLGADGWDGVQNQVDQSNFPALNNSFYCSQYSRESDNAALQAFIEKYYATYGIEENMFAVLGYDAMMIMLAAIDNAGSTDGDAIIEALGNTNHTGLTGTTTFDENRNPIREAFIVAFENGAPKVLEPFSITR